MNDKWILCPQHRDTEPSMRVYEEYMHCFVCGAHIKLNGQGAISKKYGIKKEVTDIPGMVSYIQSLPVSRFRGFQLPFDDQGYYILWPDKSFYKRRNFHGKTRYIGPKGVKPPLFFYKGSSDRLILIEGEMNTMTIQSYCNTIHTIASPGAASEFMRHIKEYEGYKKITLIMDHDGAGVAFGLQLKEMLLKQKKHVTLVTRVKDYNQLLQDEGLEAVRLEFERDIK